MRDEGKEEQEAEAEEHNKDTTHPVVAQEHIFRRAGID
jgi:hypothetical protein